MTDDQKQWQFSGADHDFEAFLSDRFQQLRPILLAVARKFARTGADADQLVGDALARAWQYRANFEKQGGNVRLWLCKAVVNVALTDLRRRRRRNEVAIDDIVNLDIVDPTALQHVQARDGDVERAKECIEKLTDPRRTYLIAWLFDPEMESMNAIAEVHQVTRQNVSMLIKSALRDVRQCMGEPR